MGTSFHLEVGSTLLVRIRGKTRFGLLVRGEQSIETLAQRGVAFTFGVEPRRAFPPAWPKPIETGLLQVMVSWLRPFVLNCIGCLLERGPLLFPLGGLGGFGRYDVDGTAEKDNEMGCDGVSCPHLIAFTLSPIRGRWRTLERVRADPVVLR